MLYFFTGTDREKIRLAVHAGLSKEEKAGARVVRITDAHAIADLQASLQGGGLFAEKRTVVFDGIFSGESVEMAEMLRAALPQLVKQSEIFFISEVGLDAATRKYIEKFAETTGRFDAEKAKSQTTIFALANALRAGDKKALWVGLMREYSHDEAPEAVHGVLFWAAKDMFLKASNDKERERARALIQKLAQLPHEARRAGFDLGYALEHFVLSRS